MTVACFGNADVVRALETLLAEAREGRAVHLVAVMLSEGKQQPSGGWFGSHLFEAAAIHVTEKVAEIMKDARQNTVLPPRAPDVPADRVCYSVPQAPMGYDFINWLVDAEITRRREGAAAPLKVGFWFGRDGATGLDTSIRRQMLDHVLRPALALIGAVEDETAVDGRFKEYFSFRPIVEAARAGEKVPRLAAPQPIRQEMQHRYGGCVTITLREANYFPHRNSNLDAWLDFAGSLWARDERIVFVRDTAKADAPFYGFETCAAASRDLHVRLALYESAKMNMFVSNGPASLGFFADWPWLTFIKMEADGHTYQGQTPTFWRDIVGIEPGGQFPWSRPDQRIIWASDDYENLMQAWTEHVACETPIRTLRAS